MRSRRKRNFAALLAMLLLLCGCTSLKSIQEDSVREDLPQIDPEAGTTRSITATLYYRLSNEPYLVAIRHSLTVRSNESAEDAIVRTLLSGVPPLAENVSNAFADGTEALEIARDGSILYVTLSEEYLDDSALREVKEESSQLLAREEITEAEYNARIAAAKEALYADRRAGLYAIVNSITAYAPDIRVMLLVNRKGTAAERLRYDELGIEDMGGAVSSLLEPMEFQEDVLATPASIVECILRHMKAGELDEIYGLFAEMESGEGQKPAYAEFEAALNAVGRVTDYAVYDYTVGQNANYASVEAEIDLTDGESHARRIIRTRLQLKNEGEIYRVGYYAFLDALGEKA